MLVFRFLFLDAETGNESPVRATVRGAALCHRVMVCMFVTGAAQIAREREWAEAIVYDVRITVSGTFNFRIKFCHALELRDRVVGSGPTQQAKLVSDPGNPSNQPFGLRTKFS